MDDKPILRVECGAGHRAESAPGACTSASGGPSRPRESSPRSCCARGQPQAHPGLGPTDPLEKVSPEIAFWSVDTLIVGHLPYLGRLAALLLVSDPDRPLLAFQPGSAACLEQNTEDQWVVAWMVRPELLAPARA